MITRHYSAEQQTVKQTLTMSKNSTEFTNNDKNCHRDKLALINRRWSVKKVKD